MNDLPSNDPPIPPERTLTEVLAEKAGVLQTNDTVATAGERMRALHTEDWPVADGRKLVGMIKQPNPDLQAAGRGHDPHATKVAEGMSRDPVYCFEDQTCAEAQVIMEREHLRYLPVVDRELRIVGILHRAELALPPEPGAHG